MEVHTVRDWYYLGLSHWLCTVSSMDQGCSGYSRPLTIFFGQEKDNGPGQICRKGENGTHILKHWIISIICKKQYMEIQESINDNGT